MGLYKQTKNMIYYTRNDFFGYKETIMTSKERFIEIFKTNIKREGAA